MKDEKELILAEEAMDLIRKNIKSTGLEEVFLKESVNRVIAEDIYAPLSFPEFKTSAMDGYALKSDNTLSASEDNPIAMKIIEEIAAGNIPSKSIEDFHCAKIYTGAYLPEGADAVIMQEYTQQIENNIVVIYRPAKKNENIREIGEDFQKGQLLFRRGHKLSERDLMLMATIGIQKIKVYKKPVVGIITTGSELLSSEKEKEEGKIRECNSFYLIERINKLGANPIYYGIIKDDEEEIRKKITDALEECNVIITTGGISVGSYDLVKNVLNNIGVKEVFWKLKIKPGKPLYFGKYKDKFIFGLPGNPGSAFITFEIFVRYALNLMNGNEEPLPHFNAYLEEEIKNKGNRTFYLRTIVFNEEGKLKIKMSGAQGSAIISSIAKCNSIAELPYNKEIFRKGDLIKVYPLF